MPRSAEGGPGWARAGRARDLAGGLQWENEEGVGLHSHGSQEPALCKGLWAETNQLTHFSSHPLPHIIRRAGAVKENGRGPFLFKHFIHLVYLHGSYPVAHTPLCQRFTQENQKECDVENEDPGPFAPCLCFIT